MQAGPKRRARVEQAIDLNGSEDEQRNDRLRTVQPPAPVRRQGRRKRKADSELEDFSDEGVIEILRRVTTSTHRSRTFGSRAWVKEAPENKNAAVALTAEIRPPGPPRIVSGTSTAIRHNAAFGIGLQPLDFNACGKQPSCLVCADDMDSLLQFQVSVASACNYAPVICLVCWEQHIAPQAETRTWDAITCPHPDCGAILNHGNMQQFAPREVFGRYDKFQTAKALQDLVNYRTCAHGGCGSGGFVEEEEQPT